MRTTNSPTLEGKFCRQVGLKGLKYQRAKPRLVSRFPAMAHSAIS